MAGARQRPIDLAQTPVAPHPIEAPIIILLPQGSRELAGWWQRVTGFILDGIIVSVPTLQDKAAGSVVVREESLALGSTQANGADKS
jgi:hypothetical protein